MVYDLFLHLLLDLIYQYFVEDYSTYVHQRYWHVVFYEQLYAKKCENLDEMDTFLEKHDLPKLNEEEAENMHHPKPKTR